MLAKKDVKEVDGVRSERSRVFGRKFTCMIIGKLCVPDVVVGVGWGKSRSGIGTIRELSREGWKNSGPRLRTSVESV